MPTPTTKSRQALKSRFARNAIPTQQDFADLIDASISQTDDGLLKLPDKPLGLVRQTSDQAILRLFADSNTEEAAWELQLTKSEKPDLGLAGAAGKLALIVDAETGNVGVGIDSPSPDARLHVGGSLTVEGKLQLNANQEIVFADNGQIRSLDNHHRLIFRRSENKFELREYGDIIFSPGSEGGTETAKLVLLANGNLGVGTTTPEQRVDINGSLRATTAGISKNAYDEGENDYHLELYSPDTSNCKLYTKIRFHQYRQYWGWIGYHGLDGNNSGEYVFWNLNQKREARIRAGDIIARGAVIRSAWVATGNGPDDATDSGRLISRTLKINKLFADTALRILYCDNFRVNGDNVACRWELRVDGNSVSPPIHADRYESSGNRHLHGTIMGYAKGVAAGAHEVQVWVLAHPHNGSPKDVYTGWSNATWCIEAEEVWLP
jgi:hypothetical protein